MVGTTGHPTDLSGRHSPSTQKPQAVRKRDDLRLPYCFVCGGALSLVWRVAQRLEVNVYRFAIAHGARVCFIARGLVTRRGGVRG